MGIRYENPPVDTVREGSTQNENRVVATPEGRYKPPSKLAYGAQRVASVFPGLGQPSEFLVRACLASVGFLPVTLIAATAFNLAGLRELTTHLLLPAILVTGLVVLRSGRVLRIIVMGMLVGVLATACYDLVRFGFLWSGLIATDPIPHIGRALHLHPAWVYGYLWRYLGNGSGLSVAFFALGYHKVSEGLCFGLFVCGGLLLVLVFAPLGQVMLFPLTLSTIVMVIVGHIVYGVALAWIGGIFNPNRHTVSARLEELPVPEMALV